MSQQIKQNKLDKVVKGLLSLNSVKHKKPKEPTRAELNKKFVLRISRDDGKVEIKEIVRR